MSKFVRWLLWAAVVFFIFALLVTCGTYLSYKIPGKEPTNNSTSSRRQQSSSVPYVSPTDSETPSPEPSDPTPSDNSFSNYVPVEDLIGQLSPTINRHDLAQTGYATLEIYLLRLVQTTNTTWSEYLTDSGLQNPAMMFDITSDRDKYTSKCTRNGAAIVVTSSHTSTLYCSLDGTHDGAVALPINAFPSTIGQFGKDPSLAVTATWATSHIVIASLQRQLALPAVEGTNRQYLAACLSGAVMNGVYPGLSGKQTRTSLEKAYAKGNEVDGVDTSPVVTDEQMYTAWTVGYSSGAPTECIKSFWK